jgi:hypothetical protein
MLAPTFLHYFVAGFAYFFRVCFRILVCPTFELLGVKGTVPVHTVFFLFHIEHLKARTDIIITALLVEIELIV